ncbi:MAG TPA: hypothetical protein VJ885_10815, partial [Thermoanaerobaculia bacterium]|nr:hypothetical protein [Thermoanaerobaculia bacterium]
SPLLAPRPLRQGSRSAETTPAHPHPIARLKARPELSAAEGEEHQDRRLALLLVAAALVLLLIVIAAGWLLIGERKNIRPVFPPVAHGIIDGAAAAASPSPPSP